MTTPARKDLKPGNWIDDRHYVADVSGGVATVLARQIGETMAEVEQRGREIRGERMRVQANRRRRKRFDNSG